MYIQETKIFLKEKQMNCRFFLFPMAVLLMLLTILPLSAQSLSVDFKSKTEDASHYGAWSSSSGRLVQNDVQQPLAKINFRIPQSGEMDYSFDVHYEGGAIEDRKGGFGIQVFVDRAHPGKSWGDGRSYLLWLNYDEHATYGGKGFRAQVYKSINHHTMTLMKGYDIPLDSAMLTEEHLDRVVPVRLTVNGDTGEVKVWNPLQSGTYYRFFLDKAPDKGAYIALRTNSMAVSFDNLSVHAAR